MSYKSFSSSPSLLRITVGSLGLKATWSGTAFYTALLSMRRWILFPMFNRCFHIYFFQQSVLTAWEAGDVPSHSWNNPLFQQPWGRELWSLFWLCKFTYKREKMNGFSRHKWSVPVFRLKHNGTTMSRDLSDVLSHPNRAGQSQIKCPCESCKMPLYWRTFKADPVLRSFRCYMIAHAMQVLNSSLKNVYIYLL